MPAIASSFKCLPTNQNLSLSLMASSSIHSSITLLFFCSLSYLILFSICYCTSLPDRPKDFALDSLRVSLQNQEDFILYSLIERARYPYNYPAYNSSYLSYLNCSLVELYVREAEANEAKFGRYQNPEELPFFPDDIPFQLVPPHKFSKILYPPAASVNVSRIIWDMYFNELLPLFTTKGDDGNYQQTAASDLICLQALSKRIHYGRFVAESKFRDAPQDYIPAIQAKNTETLIKQLTFTSVEETVVERVFKKAMIFGQDVTLENKNATEAKSKAHEIKYKVEPSIAAKLYRDWVIPLTKQVEVDYLLHRLD